MIYQGKQKIKLKRAAINVLIFCILMYFLFHLIYGNRGIIAYFSKVQEYKESYQELTILRSKRLKIENKVQLLRPDNVDADAMDEAVRNSLGVSKPKEKMFRREVDSAE